MRPGPVPVPDPLGAGVAPPAPPLSGQFSPSPRGGRSGVGVPPSGATVVLGESGTVVVWAPDTPGTPRTTPTTPPPSRPAAMAAEASNFLGLAIGVSPCWGRF